jgi:hypothetical protein
VEDHVIVDSSFSAPINAPLRAVDLPAWCFTLPDAEYQDCSPAHFAAGATTARDGRRMSINVEVIGGTLLIEHYVEVIAKKDRLVLESVSDLFTPNGRTNMHVTWELSVKATGSEKCEFTNRVHTRATDELLAFLARQGIPFDLFCAQRKPLVTAHNKQETPFFAASIERHALRTAEAA